jgi:hypothetical protein
MLSIGRLSHTHKQLKPHRRLMTACLHLNHMAEIALVALITHMGAKCYQHCKVPSIS